MRMLSVKKLLFIKILREIAHNLSNI